MKAVGLLGTRYTMEHDFYKQRILSHGIDVLIPDEAGLKSVHNIIYDELVHGVVNDASIKAYRDVILKLAENGAQGVILGCTEINLVANPDTSGVQLFDTTRIHVDAVLKELFA